MEKEEKQVIDETIKATAQDIVDRIVPIDDEYDDDEELDRDGEMFMGKAVPLLKDALKKWRAEHGPDEHCDIRVVRNDNDEFQVIVTPKE